MSGDILMAERKGSTLVLTLNRPAPRNAQSSPLLARVRSALLEAE